MKRTRLKQKTRLKKQSKSLIAKLKRELTPLFREYIRRRDKDICQKCGKRVVGRNSHPSHVLPKKTYKSLEWDEDNVKLLCWHCHNFFWHLSPTESMVWFIEKFPSRWLALQYKKNRTIQVSEIELQAMIDYYKDELSKIS